MYFPEPWQLCKMQISSVNDVKIYNLSHGKSLPEVRRERKPAAVPFGPCKIVAKLLAKHKSQVFSPCNSFILGYFILIALYSNFPLGSLNYRASNTLVYSAKDACSFSNEMLQIGNYRFAVFPMYLHHYIDFFITVAVRPEEKAAAEERCRWVTIQVWIVTVLLGGA